MEKINDIYLIKCAGHPKKLYCDIGMATCGNIKDGISFKFEDEGWWVLSFEELRKVLTLYVLKN